MSLPQNFDAKELFRYVIPGIFAFGILLPYISFFFPDWNSFDSAQKLGFAVFLMVAFGLLIDIIVDLFAGVVANWCCNSSRFKKVFKVDDPSVFCVSRQERTELLAGLNVPDRNIIWWNTALAHMLTGTAIVFFVSIFINLFKLLTLLRGFPFSSNAFIQPLLYLIGSCLLSIASLALAVNYAKFRHDFYKAFKKGRLDLST